MSSVDALTVVVSSFNDWENFELTLASLKGELQPRDQLVISDSSADRERFSMAPGEMCFDCTITYLWNHPRGVYAAQNAGIRAATRPWVQIINSGDRMLPGGRALFEQALAANPGVDIHVFGQNVRSGESGVYTFTPNMTTIWPHQSVIIRKSVYDAHGVYSEKHRYSSDQMFLARVRRRVRVEIHPESNTEYLLGGLSSTVRLRHLCEVFIVRRLLRQNLVKASVCSFLFPPLRRLLEIGLGEAGVARIKRLVFPRYKKQIR